MAKLVSKKRIIESSLENPFILDVLKTIELTFPGTESRSNAVDLFVTFFEIKAKKIFDEYYKNKEIAVRARITSSGRNRMENIPGKVESILSLLLSDDVLQFEFTVDGRTVLVLKSWNCKESFSEGSYRHIADIYIVERKNEKIFTILKEMAEIM